MISRELPVQLNRQTGLPSSVEVTCPGRVHFGLLQMSEAFEVINMGLGAALAGPQWRLTATVAIESSVGAKVPVQSDLLDAVLVLLEDAKSKLSLPSAEIIIAETVPQHRGFGSKTSLLCAVLAALFFLDGRPDEWPSGRFLTGRGGTSGIGVHTAVRGGFILDSGHHENVQVRKIAPSRARTGHDMPAVIQRWDIDFPVLIAVPKDVVGLHGQEELDFFSGQGRLVKSEADEVAGIVLYAILPALTAQNNSLLLEGLRRLQEVGFKKREWLAQPQRVHEVRKALDEHGASLVALSSVGPALVAFSDDVDDLYRKASEIEGVDLYMTRLSNEHLRTYSC